MSPTLLLFSGSSDFGCTCYIYLLTKLFIFETGSLAQDGLWFSCFNLPSIEITGLYYHIQTMWCCDDNHSLMHVWLELSWTKPHLHHHLLFLPWNGLLKLLCRKRPNSVPASAPGLFRLTKLLSVFWHNSPSSLTGWSPEPPEILPDLPPNDLSLSS